MIRSVAALLLTAFMLVSSPRAEDGTASYYSIPQQTASGVRFNPNHMTAAHRTLPLGTVVTVTNKLNGSSVVVKITDRGPYVKRRVIDLSRAAAARLGFIARGLAPVSIKRH